MLGKSFFLSLKIILIGIKNASNMFILFLSLGTQIDAALCTVQYLIKPSAVVCIEEDIYLPLPAVVCLFLPCCLQSELHILLDHLF